MKGWKGGAEIRNCSLHANHISKLTLGHCLFKALFDDDDDNNILGIDVAYYIGDVLWRFTEIYCY